MNHCTDSSDESDTGPSKCGEEGWLFIFDCLMVFNATFNNISGTCISWWSVLLVENTTDLSQVTGKLYHIMLYTSPWLRFEITSSVVKGTDCIGSCKSNYHTITTMTAPVEGWYIDSIGGVGKLVGYVIFDHCADRGLG